MLKRSIGSENHILDKNDHQFVGNVSLSDTPIFFFHDDSREERELRSAFFPCGVLHLDLSQTTQNSELLLAVSASTLPASSPIWKFP